MESKKTILVTLGELARPVVFAAGDSDDVTRAKEATRGVFSDTVKPGDRITMQLKDEAWGGVFVDNLSGQIPDRSVLKAIVTAQVGPKFKMIIL